MLCQTRGCVYLWGGVEISLGLVVRDITNCWSSWWVWVVVYVWYDGVSWRMRVVGCMDDASSVVWEVRKRLPT